MNKGAGIGGITILVIFIVLILAVFSVTAVTTANADLTLSKRTVDGVTAFYAADGKAQGILSAIDALLAENSRDFSIIEQEFGTNIAYQGATLSFYLPVTNYTRLFVEIDLRNQGYNILTYLVEPIEENINYSQKLNVWTGESE